MRKDSSRKAEVNLNFTINQYKLFAVASKLLTFAAQYPRWVS